jgi:hypothetical protein
MPNFSLNPDRHGRRWARLAYLPVNLALGGLSMRLLFLVTVLFGLHFAQAAHGRDVLLLGEGDSTTMNNWEVSRQKWEVQPKWSPTSEQPPPLSIQKAVELAEAWMKKHKAGEKQFIVWTVSLMSQATWATDVRDGWFYRIEFYSGADSRGMGRMGQFVAVVMLDGSVVEPRPEPARRQ